MRLVRPLHTLAGALALSILLAGAPARAQQGDPTAAAEDLFQRGKTLMTAGKYAEACPLLAESYRLDAAGGTLQNLAVCYESSSKWASAYARFQELRALSRNASPPRTDRVKLAEEHLAKITGRVSRVIVDVPEALAANAEVQIDGVVYQRASWAPPGIAIDPGEHAILVTAPGKLPYRTTLNASTESSEQHVRVPVLADAPIADATSERRPPRPVDVDREKREAEERKLRLTGFIVGGAGIAVLSAGAIFGALTIAANNAGKDECDRDTSSAPRDQFNPETKHCYEKTDALTRANDKKDDARTFATLANILVPVGIIGAAIGAYLVLGPGAATRRSTPHASLRVVPLLGGAAMEGRF